MSGQQQNKRNSSLMNKETQDIVEEPDETQEETPGKKSPDNGLNGSVEDYGGSSSSSASNTSNILRPSPTPTRKTPSPTASPRGSPKLGNRNEAHHVKSPSQSSISVNAEKSDNAEDSVSKSSDSSSQQTSSDFNKSTTQVDAEKPKAASKISERAKKKSWYNVLYPSYKSRSEDFKKLFKEVPDDERLVVDYSCALQRDILVHGRLYVSQNYLCFYANIFRWETCLCIKWKDVESITKEKTARVIPNAILVSTKTEKYFLTSFTTRDKAFLMLFRVWQNALMDKQMQPQEMWQWVHNCYGDELGLTSDDEDYIDPYLSKEEDQSGTSLLPIEARNKSTGSSEDQNSTDNKLSNSNMVTGSDGTKVEVSPKNSSDEKVKMSETKRKNTKNARSKDDSMIKTSENLPTDSSNSSDSEEDKSIPFISTAECTSMHEGRQLVHTILPINVDTLFNLLFSKSKFLVDFHAGRKSTNMAHGNWTIGEDGLKVRTVNVTVALTHVGPKTSNVTETQVMRECSQPGQLYSIDVNSVNAGIPYADSFCVLMHYCLVKTVDDHTMLSVHCQIKFKKSIWGVVKGFIEKNTWAGLEDFYTALLRALQSEYCIPPAKGKGRRPRRGTSTLPRPIEEAVTVPALQPDVAKSKLPSPNAAFTESSNKYKLISWSVIVLLTALIFLNVILLFKLWNLESRGFGDEAAAYFPDFSALKDLPKNHEDWIELLRQQEALHETEMRKWQAVLQTAIELLKKTESTLSDLLLIIQFQRASPSTTQSPVPDFERDL
ncbi:unnamed protein product [Hermetia illucens]|uniref:VASt domain-containing protein n=1 Tax=Hermetia illucens TaxID=343691 RepID=A0A7R8Z0F4_HERIL|nr:protein Aster-B-like isoform X2 [Hermetia illucens]CAD7088666.1 unnamed protein product [Hermetia illucens]